MSATLRVLRVQLITWPGLVAWPWGILAASFLVNLAIFSSIGGQPADAFTGGLSSIYVVVLAVCVQWATQLFPFALGMSATRRGFYAASTLLLVAESVTYGVLLYLLSLLERATGGWGESIRFFNLPFLAGHGALALIAMYTVPFLVFGFIGIFTGLIHHRWGVNGLFTLLVTAIVVFGGAAILVTWRRQWTAIGHWIVDQPTLALTAGWPAILAVLLAAGGYLAIRRATT